MMNKWAHIVAMLIVVVGALNWGILGLTGRNVVATLFGQFGARLIYIVVGLAALYVAFQRDTYLPFLGETVVPCTVLREQVPDHADMEVTVHGLRPGAKVLFWASEPETEGLARIVDWRRAYLGFANAGVAVVDTQGHATLRIRKPQQYTVPLKGALKSHVHWRTCGDNGFLGQVETTMVD